MLSSRVLCLDGSSRHTSCRLLEHVVSPLGTGLGSTVPLESETVTGQSSSESTLPRVPLFLESKSLSAPRLPKLMEKHLSFWLRVFHTDVFEGDWESRLVLSGGPLDRVFGDVVGGWSLVHRLLSTIPGVYTTSPSSRLTRRRGNTSSIE